MNKNISHEKWNTNPIIQACVRLTEIENQLELLDKERSELLKVMKEKDELTFYAFQKLSLSDKQSFLLLDKCARE